MHVAVPGAENAFYCLHTSLLVSLYTNLAHFSHLLYTKIAILWRPGGHDRVFVSMVAASLYKGPLNFWDYRGKKRIRFENTPRRILLWHVHHDNALRRQWNVQTDIF